MIDTSYSEIEIEHYEMLRSLFFDEQVNLLFQQQIRIKCKCEPLLLASYPVWRRIFI